MAKKFTTEKPFIEEGETQSIIEKILREGARKMLQQALENEIEEYLMKYSQTDKKGHRLVVRNGYHPQREIITGIGPVTIRAPRVDNRKIDPERKNPYTSAILPRYLRRIPSIDNLIPALYLKGLSTNGFQDALASILGEGAKGLSATNIVRLKKTWEDEFKCWSNRYLSNKKYAYIWVDGIHFNVRLEDERCCILVIIGVDEQGNKELIAVEAGFRESALSWKEILLSLRARGLEEAPKLAIGDGALGFWKALDEVFPHTKRQRCWVHKTANILDKMPKKLQPKAKSLIHEMYMSDTEENALKAYDHFISVYGKKYPKATNCLTKDKDDLFSFYSFPAMHWVHIRTTNPIESTFATVRLRTKRTKGCGSRIATLTMTWKLCCEASKTWRKMKGYKDLPKVIQGMFCKDGNFVEEVA